jgi:hypothetical protein
MSWYTAAELAGVHGLPNSERGIRKKATTESWENRPRTSGKGVEYNSASLSAESQRALQISAGKKAAAAAPAKPVADKSDDLSNYQRLRSHERAKVDAIVCVLAELDAFHQASGLSKGKAVAEFVIIWNAGEIAAPADVRAQLQQFSRATVYNWQKAQREQGLSGLIDTRGRHGRTPAHQSDDINQSDRRRVRRYRHRPTIRTPPSRMDGRMEKHQPPSVHRRH